MLNKCDRSDKDWGVDPSPDLVIEIDVTSYTDINDYLPYKVPEVWLFKKGELLIYIYWKNRITFCEITAVIFLILMYIKLLMKFWKQHEVVIQVQQSASYDKN
jgi:Uma2 family endonuclease